MNRLSPNTIKGYLSSILCKPVEVLSVDQLGGGKPKDLKSFGYGKPYLIRCVMDGEETQLILETMSENSFGHDHFSDRAQNLLWYHSVSNHLPKHAKSLDVGAFTGNAQMISLGKAEEFFVVSEFITGEEYAADLKRIQSAGALNSIDLQRVRALANYLAEIHSVKKEHPSLYARRIRELLGHGECIMGLIDNYPLNDPIVTPEVLQNVELECVRWRWKIKDRIHRLSQVHGDFHPWNILFQDGTNFRVLDRSRGEWGEPADDVTCITINYLFYSLQKIGEYNSLFEKLFLTFWETYLKASKDEEILSTVQPFYAWRALVLLNPIWYPSLDVSIRKTLLQFLRNILFTDPFRPEQIRELL